ncbi:MAG: gliding motility-associated ABC transporter ATP-binding subunit GldA [Bacteroidetes bacterium]|nr:gliding motility-associated ABC transporter ATP-binding subunit GldA [Bacteroidota bacterium]
MSVSVSQLTKVFKQQKAVDNISFEVSPGEILGFLGPNGAGKSTTMKIITCFWPPTSGRVEVCGQEVQDHPLLVKQLIGYLPEDNPLYPDMYVQEHLRFIGGFHGLSGKILKSRITEMIERCGLEREQNKVIGALSKGYRQRVGLAQVLLHDPKVLILDEPTSGLDPNQILEIRSLIKERSKDKTVILSTHIMQEVQSLCDRVVIINRGKLVADQGVAELKAGSLKQKLVTIEIAEEFDTDGLLQIEGITDVTPLGKGKYLITGSMEQDIRPLIFKFATEHQLTLKELKEEEHSLEHIFHELTNN